MYLFIAPISHVHGLCVLFVCCNSEYSYDSNTVNRQVFYFTDTSLSTPSSNTEMQQTIHVNRDELETDIIAKR